MLFNAVCTFKSFNMKDIFCISNKYKVNKNLLMQVISWIIQFQYRNFKNINVNVHYHGIFIPNLPKFWGRKVLHV